MLFALAIVAVAFTRARSQPLLGWQKLFGAIAVVSVILILLQPEFLALGLFSDTAFFDMLVLAMSLQMHMWLRERFAGAPLWWPDVFPRSGFRARV